MKKTLLLTLISLFVLPLMLVAPASAQTGVPPSNSSQAYLNDVNLVGSDIGVVWDLNDPGRCEVECKKNTSCKAWTFVKPGAIPGIPRSGLAGFCALKGAIPDKVKDNCCVSGYPTYAISGYSEVVDPDEASAKLLYHRFQLVMNGEAILDKETNLIWERNLDASHQMDWAAAYSYCLGSTKGNRKGWRLPSAWELASLHAPGNEDHHFRFSEKLVFWTSTLTKGKRPIGIGSISDVRNYSDGSPIRYKIIPSPSGLKVVNEGEKEFPLPEVKRIIDATAASPFCVRDWYY